MLAQPAFAWQHSCSMKCPLAIAAAGLCAFSNLLAWGPEGHRTIAAVALELLEQKNPAAAAKVKEILAGEDIRDSSIWPDDVRKNKIASRSGRFADTPEGKAFNEAHPENPTWHYVDLPLGVNSYGEDKRFVGENDVVVTIGRCIDVLEGKSEFMSKRDALRWITHTIGDVHQPLHVASGVYRFDADGKSHLITEPDEAAEHPEGRDSGGNKLLLQKDLPLHKYWDENLVAAVAETEEQLASILRKKIEELKEPNAGPVRDWPAKWAMESVEGSRVLFRGFYAGKRFPRTGSYWTLYVNLNKGAKEEWTKIVEMRLAKAAKNLAETLGAIQWK
jgi:hypothetical protein